MGDADLVFLPWTRRGASAGVLTPDTLGPDQPGQATATVTLTINGGPTVPVPVTVMGPGHVTGLDGRQVIRTDPAPGSHSFEANYLPLVEFDEPALPWLFTPAGAGVQARLRPWLCLVAVRTQDGVRLDPPSSGSLPVLRIQRPARPGAELPDPADTWAWAHAQVTAAAGTDLGPALANPAGSLARLLCPRVLAPDTEYLACVVPTFELGRKAGLGQEITAADEARLAPAWDLAAAEVELPVYYSWTFSTGAGGDFQSLATLLTARPLPPGVGATVIDVSHSGLSVDLPVGTGLGLAGALRPVGSTPPDWPDASLRSAWESALVPVLNAPALVAAGDPLLAPPLYGAAPAGHDRVDPARTTRWFEQLNLAPTHRAVAHLGTRVVQRLQDQLMASAWQQAADIARARQLDRQAELADRLLGSLRGRHLAPMAPAAGLHVIAPARFRMTRVPGPFANALAATHLAPSAYATALRRVARPRGAVNRRAQAGAIASPLATAAAPIAVGSTTAILARLQPAAAAVRFSQYLFPPGEVTLARLAAELNPPQTDFTWRGSIPEAVNGVRAHDRFEFVPPGQMVPVRGPNIRTRPGPQDTDAAHLFRALASAHLARFNPARDDTTSRVGEDGSLDDAFALAVAGPGTPLTFHARALTTDTDPSLISPRFPQPMSRALVETSQDLMLPGLDKVPPNTVVPLETNTAFVEAFLVGLNTEMGRELLWRGFPADLAATYFDQFWDASSSPGRPPDIDPIHIWGDRAIGTASSIEDFVLLVRSELLRRYPDAVLLAVRDGVERPPVFTGAFAPDVRYAGFDIPAADIRDWSIVLMEHPSAPRFGVEVGADTGPGSHLPAVDPNAAAAAHRLRQLPVRITIPATVLLGAS